jgi:hypothetical protein
LSFPNSAHVFGDETHCRGLKLDAAQKKSLRKTFGRIFDAKADNEMGLALALKAGKVVEVGRRPLEKMRKLE